MGIEAFLWSYRDGDVASLPFEPIRNLFSCYTTDWDPATGRIHVCFQDKFTCCDIYCGPEAETTNSVGGLMISRPVQHPDLWRCVLEVMRMGHVLLFFSDDTTPLFTAADAPSHFPAELLESLGSPRYVSMPDDIPRSHEK